MARRVFFSFQYDDIFRANVVRNHWMTKRDRESAGFFDSSLWEEAKRKGVIALKRMINSGLDGTSVTCVLIGSGTYARPWIRYEILKSFQRGNRILGVSINSIKSRDQTTKPSGPNPFQYVGVSFSDSGITATLWEKVNGEWKEYTEIDGRASYQMDPVAAKYRGKGFNLSNFYSVYDWVTEDGYNNFAAWIGD